MSGNNKKLLSLLLAVVLTLGLGVTAFADSALGTSEVTTEVSGSMEGYVDPSKIDVVLTTGSVAFTIDPQHLASKTNGGAHGSDVSIDENATILFRNASTDAIPNVRYSASSDQLIVKNKGMSAVSVSLKASVISADNVKLRDATADGNNFSGDNNPSIVLKLTGDTSGDQYLSASAVTVSNELDAVNEKFFTWSYDATNRYKATIKDEGTNVSDDNGNDISVDYPALKFRLEGKANTNVNWKDATADQPKVKLVWTVSNSGAAADETATISGITVPKTIKITSGQAFELKYTPTTATVSTINLTDAQNYVNQSTFVSSSSGGTIGFTARTATAYAGMDDGTKFDITFGSGSSAVTIGYTWNKANLTFTVKTA